MRNILVISLVFLLSMVCHAQKIATSEFNGTKWKLVSPVSDYCERGMSFTMTTCTTTTKFKKNEIVKSRITIQVIPVWKWLITEQFLASNTAKDEEKEKICFKKE